MTEKQYQTAKSIKHSLDMLSSFTTLWGKVVQEVKRDEFDKEKIMTLLDNHGLLISKHEDQLKREFANL